MIDTTIPLNCTVCHGTGHLPGTSRSCLACGGERSFPGFEPREIYNSVLNKNGSLRKRVVSSGDVGSIRACFVFHTVKKYADPELHQPVSVELAVHGDPYIKHLEAVAQAVAQQVLHIAFKEPIMDLGLIVSVEGDVPNLDAMTEGELSAFWSKYHRASKKAAVALVGDRPHSVGVAATLAAYALDKSCAMKLRKEGDIKGAMVYEESMDLRYKTLPVDIRW